jgi:hypothetical protein
MSIDDGLGPHMATLDSVAYMPSEPPTINVDRSMHIARSRGIYGSASLPNLDNTQHSVHNMSHMKSVGTTRNED